MLAAALLSKDADPASGLTRLDPPPSECKAGTADAQGAVSARENACGGWEAAAEVREGEIVDGRYRIGRLLGSGAMGTVCAAHHILLDQKVAIKFLVPEYLGHSDSVARFVREARATATIKSKHVVRVLDVALNEGGVPYIVMEYLEGSDLAALLRAQGPPDVHVAVDFVCQACEAIAEAHELGIIHRDVKPANLFAVQRRGVVETIKVLDFGISKTAGLVSSTAAPGEWRPGPISTAERVTIGSPCYMSPEQMESARDVDARTDIWALGVTLCELVTGQLPFEGESLVQVYATIKSGARFRAGAGVPPGLEAVIHKCLEPERNRRYSTVAELQAALEPFRTAAVVTSPATKPTLLRESETGADESYSRASPSPRSAFVRGPDSTLVSPELGVTRRGPGLGLSKVAAIGFAAVMALAGIVALVSKGATHNASVAPPSSTAPSAVPSASRPDDPDGPAGTTPPLAPDAQDGGPKWKESGVTAVPSSESIESRHISNPPARAPTPRTAREPGPPPGTPSTNPIQDSEPLQQTEESEPPSAAGAASSPPDPHPEWLPPDVPR